MQYDAIILELMVRIKALETEVADLKTTLHTLEAIVNPIGTSDCPIADDATVPTQTPSPHSTSYTKMTEEMMEICYNYGKKAYQTPNATIKEYADMAVSETGMNRNSAIMYISAVESLLAGKVFNRSISAKALRKYFSTIHAEFGNDGLTNAITATRAHIAYRQRGNFPVDSLVALCDTFESKL